MILSMAIIDKHLSEHHNYSVYGEISEEMSIISPCLWMPGEEPRPGVLYVADAQIFDRVSAPRKLSALILIGGETNPDIDIQGLYKGSGCTFVFPGEYSLPAVFNELSGIFDYYSKWDNELLNVVCSKGTIQSFLDTGMRVFNNPITVHNTLLSTIASAYASDNEEDMKKYQDVLARRLSFKHKKLFLEDAGFQASLKHRGAGMLSGNPTGRKNIYYNYFMGNQFYYRIVVTEHFTPIRSCDLGLLEHLGKYFGIIVSSNYQETENLSLSRLLTNIIAGTADDEPHIRRQFSDYGWDSDGIFRCLVFDIHNDTVYETLAPAMCMQLNDFLPSFEFFKANKQIIAIANPKSVKESGVETTEDLKAYMRDTKLKMGISNIMRGYKWIPDLYKQAQIALDVSGRIKPDSAIYSFRDAAPYYLLAQSSEELSVTSVCSSEVIGLLDYDNAHGTDYFKTLKVYVECNFQPVIAAKKLFIHRSTFKYRIGRIQELFDFDFEDPLMRMYYSFSINLLLYFDKDKN